jgi:hypothetical protein
MTDFGETNSGNQPNIAGTDDGYLQRSVRLLLKDHDFPFPTKKRSVSAELTQYNESPQGEPFSIPLRITVACLHSTELLQEVGQPRIHRSYRLCLAGEASDILPPNVGEPTLPKLVNSRPRQPDDQHCSTITHPSFIVLRRAS